jgi:hypothetical protein
MKLTLIVSIDKSIPQFPVAVSEIVCERAEGKSFGGIAKL